MNLTDLKNNYENNPEYHKATHEQFVELVNNDEFLNEHRTYVENNVMGFGERSFQWLWKLIVDEMPSEFNFIEVGVFRGQILSLIKALASATGRNVERYGVTPLDSTGIGWEGDYRADIERLHDHFFIPKDYTLYVGLSTDPKIIEQAYNTSPYNICYVDGAHDRESVDSDLKYYAPMVKRGGLLVMDDCNNDLNFPPTGFFCGIASVTEAKVAYMSEHADEWEFIFSVVHISVFKRK